MRDRDMPRGMRIIHTGRGTSRTFLTPEQIAETRTDRMSGPTEDRYMFMDAYERFRYAVRVNGFRDSADLEKLTRRSPILEAALIEAMASLRAEGWKIS